MAIWKLSETTQNDPIRPKTGPQWISASCVQFDKFLFQNGGFKKREINATLFVEECQKNECLYNKFLLFHCTKYEYLRKQFIAKQAQILNFTSFDGYKNYVISSSQHLTKLQFIVLLSILATASW